MRDTTIATLQKGHKSLQEKYLKVTSEKRRKPQEELLYQAREMKQQKIEKERYSALKSKQHKPLKSIDDIKKGLKIPSNDIPPVSSSRKKLLPTGHNKSKFDISNVDIIDSKSNDKENDDMIISPEQPQIPSRDVSVTILPPIEKTQIQKDLNISDDVQLDEINNMMKDIIDQF